VNLRLDSRWVKSRFGVKYVLTVRVYRHDATPRELRRLNVDHVPELVDFKSNRQPFGEFVRRYS
jgi:hypothetical protein